MRRNPFARSYRELIVYQKSREVARRVFQLTKPFPREERYALTDQGRRASRSIGAQISEAWAKRRYPNHFISKLSDADGEQNETQHWLDIATDCEYLDPAVTNEVLQQLEEIGRMLQSMMDRAEDFQGTGYDRVKETSPAYGSLAEFFLPLSEH